MKKGIIWAIAWIIIICALIALSFGLIALIFYGICWAFSLTFSLKYAFGIWLICWLLSGVFKRGGKND